MQRSKILGVTLMVMLALSAVASATASAAVTVLPEKVDVKWTGESGKSTLEVLKRLFNIACQKSKWEGTIEKDKPLGLFHIDLEGCKAGFACTGLGEAKEVLLALGTYHLVFDTLGANLKDAGIGILLLFEQYHFECAGILFMVEGQVLCLIKEPNKLAKHFEITCKKGAKAGDPGELVYWDETGKEVKIDETKGGLLTIENEDGPEMSSEETAALILGKEIELMT